MGNWDLVVWYVSDRVHNNDVGFLSFLGYPVFHHEHFFGGKALDIFIDFEH